MADSFYSFSEPLNTGIDFYEADAATVAIQINVNVSTAVNLTKIAFSAANLSADVTVVSVANAKIVFASANISDLLSATVTAGTAIREGSLISVNATSSLTASGTKIAHASAAVNSTANVVTVVMKTSFASAAISSAASVAAIVIKISHGFVNIPTSSAVSAISTRVALASAAINSSVVLSIVGKISLATIRIVLENVGSASATAIKFATSAIAQVINIDDSLIRTFLLLDESPITNHNRTIDMSIEPIFTEVKNWNNRSSRYYKSSSRAARRTFNLSWSWLPNSNSSTVDGKKGRDFIKNIASDPRSHVLKIINLDDSGTTPYTETSYNVLVKDYSETLIRRDIENGVYFWDCSISLEEV